MSLLCNFKKKLGSFTLDVNLQAEDEVIALMGASGCGKSLTLKCIAGILKPDSGIIIVNGRTLFDSEKHINLPMQERRIGMLFQDYALFPNMTARKNIQTAIKHTQKNLSYLEIQKQTEQLLERFQLLGAADLHPDQLSGGQKQRLALARMLGTPIDILLLDEPFSALDSFLRWQLEQDLSQTLLDLGVTALFVSHSRDEVFRLCDKVTVMSHGKNGVLKSKHQLYQTPTTYQEGLLTGCKNLLPATYENHLVQIPLLHLSFAVTNSPKDFCYVGIRSRHIIPGFLVDHKEDYLLSSYTICSETEDVFTHIFMVYIKDSSFPLRFEVSKDIYEKMKEYPKILAIKKDEIMLLMK